MKKESKLNIGVISCSGMARNHMYAVKDYAGASIGAVCDIDKAKADEAAKMYSVENVYTDYRELLKQDDLDAVIICTPDQLHREMAIDALNAGKHVLCEKPLALTREDLGAIKEAADKSDKKFMVGQICRFTPGFVKAKELIDQGEIGELFFVESEYAHDYSHILSPGNWRTDPLRHGVVGGGCHAVDLLRWIAGDPYEVTAYSNCKMLPQYSTDDCTIAILRFPKDVIGKVFVSIGCKRDYTMRSVFYGSKGTIIADNTTPHLTVFKDDVAQGDAFFDKLERHSTPILYPVTLSDHNTIGEFKEFADIILQDKPVTMTAAEGAATISVCLSIVESADSKKTLAVKY